MRLHYKLKFFNRTFAPKKFCASDCIAQNVVTVRNLFCVNYFYIQFFCYFHDIHAIKRSFYGDYNLIESIKIVGMEHFTGTDGNWEHRTFLGLRQ